MLRLIPRMVPRAAFASGAYGQVSKFAGQYCETPSQLSLGSQLRFTEARQTMPEESTVFGGHLGLAPVHSSSRSHALTAARHSTPAKYVAAQVLLTPSQTSGASQLSPEDALQMTSCARTASLLQCVELPLQRSSRSHGPFAGRQIAVLRLTSSSGHSGASPVQLSTTSHTSSTARHTMPLGNQTSPGHARDAPSQTSAKSQPPADSRQIVPEATGAQVPSAMPVFASVHAEQPYPAPSQIESQHTPSTH